MYHFANVRIVVVSNTALQVFNSINMVTLQIIKAKWIMLAQMRFLSKLLNMPRLVEICPGWLKLANQTYFNGSNMSKSYKPIQNTQLCIQIAAFPAA